MDCRTDIYELMSTLELLEMRIQMLLVCCHIVAAFDKTSKQTKKRRKSI